MLDTSNDPSKVMTFAAMVNIGGNASQYDCNFYNHSTLRANPFVC